MTFTARSTELFGDNIVVPNRTIKLQQTSVICDVDKTVMTLAKSSNFDCRRHNLKVV